MFKFGAAQGITENYPLKPWKKAKEKPRRIKLTVDDLAKIMAHAAPHLACAIEVEFNLGTRPGRSELLALKWSDMDFKRDIII
jgi:integrase